MVDLMFTCSAKANIEGITDFMSQRGQFPMSESDVRTYPWTRSARFMECRKVRSDLLLSAGRPLFWKMSSVDNGHWCPGLSRSL